MRRHFLVAGNALRFLCVMALGAALSGCGQYGALYLRDSPPAGYKAPKPKPPKPVPYPAESAPEGGERQQN